MNHDSWTSAETASRLAADFVSGKLEPVVRALREMNKPDVIAVSILLAGHLTPAKRALLADLVLNQV